MSGPQPDFSGPHEASATSVAGPSVPRGTVVHIDSEGYTEIKDSRECSLGVESRPPPESGPVILSEETVAEAVRAGLDPLEVEALFIEADAARAEEEALRREEADRAIALHLTDEFDRRLGEAYATFAAMVDRDFGARRGFNFQGYLEKNPYDRVPPRSFRVAAPTTWTYNQIPSTVTLTDVARYRSRYHIPSNVHIYVPESKRADQEPDGLVAVDELIMEAGFWFPLHYAVSYLLASWNLALLQLSSNAWLLILCTYALFGKYKLYRLLTVAETNFLYKLANARRTVGGYHLQPRLGWVIFGIPNRVHGDPGKWFWVGGNWKAFPCDQPSTSEWSPAELEIPTDFRLRNPSPWIPSVQQLSFDSLVVWNRVRDLPQSERHVRLLKSERARLAADLLRYPRHAQIPDRQVVRYHRPPEEMRKYATMMNRFQELAQAKRAAPLVLGVRNIPSNATQRIYLIS
ncbi:hypothetical protein OROGR_030328 [Orobanche gracilis]